MLVALVISHLLMPAALTLLDNHYLCLWLVKNINKDNKNRTKLWFSLLSDISTPNSEKNTLPKWQNNSISADRLLAGIGSIAGIAGIAAVSGVGDVFCLSERDEDKQEKFAQHWRHTGNNVIKPFCP